MKSFLIGSLPHTSVDEALDASFSLSVPTLVTLPKIDEDEFMVDQALREIDGYTYVNHGLRENGPDYKSPLRFVAAKEFFKRLNGSFKWQACGPLTLASSLDHHPETEDILAKYFKKLVLTQSEFHSKNSSEFIFFLDEPVLAFSGKHADLLEKFLNDLRREKVFENAIFGLHCCSKVEKEILENLSFDLFSLDPTLYDTGDFFEIQNMLGQRLVYAPVDSKGVAVAYKPKDEVYVSTTCGQALSSQEDVSLILEGLGRN